MIATTFYVSPIPDVTFSSPLPHTMNKHVTSFKRHITLSTASATLYSQTLLWCNSEDPAKAPSEFPICGPWGCGRVRAVKPGPEGWLIYGPHLLMDAATVNEETPTLRSLLLFSFCNSSLHRRNGNRVVFKKWWTAACFSSRGWCICHLLHVDCLPVSRLGFCNARGFVCNNAFCL